MKSCKFRKLLLGQAFCATALSDCSPKVLRQTVRFAHQYEMTPAVEQKKSPFIYLVIYTQTKVVYFKKCLIRVYSSAFAVEPFALCPAIQRFTQPLRVVTNGEEALAYLDGFGQYADRAQFPMPDIILLDLKMPKMDGFEVLRAVRNQPNLHAIRIIVLTSSQDIFDLQKAYALGASSFLVSKKRPARKNE